jgi:hypothetical protein
VSEAVVLGSLLRTAVGVVTRRSLGPIAVYARIGRLAGSSLLSGRAGELKCRGINKAVGQQRL